MKYLQDRSGYVYLLTVLVVGIVASAVTFSFLLLASSSARTGIAIHRSAETVALAQACAEYAIRQLTVDPEYAGSETRSYGNGSCDILQIMGTGNENRTVCTEATIQSVTRRFEIIIQELLPQAKVYSWQEVSVITACSY